MTIGNTREALAERSFLREDDIEISERAYNAIIGGVLLWGFLLNYLIVKLWGPGILNYAYRNGTGLILIGYFVSAFTGAFMVRSESPVMSFIGYNLIAVPVGILLSVYLDGYSPALVREAILITGGITLVFLIAAMIYPDFFLSMGRVLGIGLTILIIGQIVCAIFFPAVSLAWLAAGLFACFIGYDWARCSVCACTVDNAVDAAANLYLDIINLFLRVLQILGKSKRRN